MQVEHNRGRREMLKAQFKRLLLACSLPMNSAMATVAMVRLTSSLPKSRQHRCRR